MRDRNPLVLGWFQKEGTTDTAGLVNVLEVAQKDHTATMQTTHFGHSSLLIIQQGFGLPFGFNAIPPFYFFGFIPGSNLGAGLGAFMGAPAPGIILGAPAPGIIGILGAPPIGGILEDTLPLGNLGAAFLIGNGMNNSFLGVIKTNSGIGLVILVVHGTIKHFVLD